MIIQVTNFPDLKIIASQKVLKFIHEGETYGITWDVNRQQWWFIQERSEYNGWYSDDNLPRIVLDAIEEKVK